MKYPILLLSLLFSFLWLKSPETSPPSISGPSRSNGGDECVEWVEIDFLMAFYYSTGGPNWHIKWDFSNDNPCLYGVSPNGDRTVGCINLANRDTTIDSCNETISSAPKGGNGLEGTLPDTIRLSRIRRLILSKNKLSGPIPDFSLCQELELLYLNDNCFDGPIPTALLSLSSLKRLFLQDNKLAGNLPEDIATTLPLIELFAVNNNKLHGLIPNFRPSDDAAAEDIQLDKNRFTFEDILPHLESNNSASRFNIQNQAKVFVDTLINAAIGYPLRINLGIDSAVTTNLYSWDKDSSFLRQETVNELYFENINLDDAGIYTCTITNTIIPPIATTPAARLKAFLTLYSHPIEIKPCDPGILDLRNTFLCEGESLRFSDSNGTTPLIFDADNPTGTIIYPGLAANGCDSIIEIDIQYYPTDVVASAEAEATFTCQPELMIQANSVPFTTGFWHSPNSLVTFDDETAPITTVENLQPGNNTIVWHLLHESCRNLNASDTLNLFYQPEFSLLDTTFTIVERLRLGKWLEVPLNDSLQFLQDWQLEIVTPPTLGEMQFDLNTGIIWRYQLFDPCPGLDSFQYQLVNEDCVYSDIATVRLHIVPRSRDDNEIPDVITPNGDGLNDTFIIPGIHNNLPGFEVNRLIIFNSRGNVVLDQQDYQNDWDGDGLPTAIYNYRFKAGEQKPLYGQVTIIR